MTVNATFTIRETVYSTGHVSLDASLWEATLGYPLPRLEALTIEQLRTYCERTGADVNERNRDVDEQVWFDLELMEAAA